MLLTSKIWGIQCVWRYCVDSTRTLMVPLCQPFGYSSELSCCPLYTKQYCHPKCMNYHLEMSLYCLLEMHPPLYRESRHTCSCIAFGCWTIDIHGWLLIAWKVSSDISFIMGMWSFHSCGLSIVGNPYNRNDLSQVIEIATVVWLGSLFMYIVWGCSFVD